MAMVPVTDSTALVNRESALNAFQSLMLASNNSACETQVRMHEASLGVITRLGQELVGLTTQNQQLMVNNATLVSRLTAKESAHRAEVEALRTLIAAQDRK